LFLTRVGQSVGLDEVIQFLWGSDQPASAASVVHKYLSALRHSFEPELPARKSGRWLVRQGSGYRLEVDDDCLDLLRFRRLTGQARQEAKRGRHDEAATTFVEALGLWKGQCAAGTEFAPGNQSAFATVDQEGSRVAQEAADSALHGGSAQQVLAVLRQTAARDRLDEALQARLMLVLAAAGRQAEALESYHFVRGVLSEDLGIDPGPELSSAYQQVLRQQRISPTTVKPWLPVSVSEHNEESGREPETDHGADAGRMAVDHPAPGPVAPLVPMVRPAQLPAGLSTFVGRRDELTHLDSLVPQPDEAGHAVSILGIDGMAGVGKTCLAIHWAQTLTDHFPDGQLYVNLRGFDPGDSAVPAGDALRGFLEALGVPTERVPSNPSSRACLYRSLLAGRRMLVVLDNARDAEQVRDLLPSAPGCLVIVTSRTQLTGLAATHDASILNLNPFSEAEAQEALARKVGSDRVANEPAAVEDINTFCAGLPLAVAIVAARAATAKGRTLGDISDELWDENTRLDAFTLGDPTTDIRTVFSWSYQLLTPQAARLFRLVCPHAGPEISLPAIANLAGLPASQVRSLLGELCRAQFLTEHRPGRYTGHDLLRLYGSELSNDQEREPDRRAALNRLLDHYLHAAHQAQSRFHLLRQQVPLSTVAPDLTSERVSDHDQAMVWFTTEHQVLSAMIQKAAHHGFSDHAWQLALSMREFCQWSGNWDDWIRTTKLALAAAQRCDDHLGQAHSHENLGTAYYHLGDIDEAVTHLQQALDLFTKDGCVTEYPDVHIAIGAALAKRGRQRETSGLHQEALELHGVALEHCREALTYSRAGGNQQAEALTLAEMGWCQGQLGHRKEGIDAIEKAKKIYRDLNGDDHHGQAYCWVKLGDLYHSGGEYQDAVECYERAIMLYRRLGIRSDEAGVFHVLGEALLALGNKSAADTAWRRAFAIYDGLHLPQAEILHAKLYQEERRTLAAIP
jgi:DNA-binding SARP family transcriptional activator/tetratricopeptide (TPR) repeat protein